jgi:hypothetical protein
LSFLAFLCIRPYSSFYNGYSKGFIGCILFCKSYLHAELSITPWRHMGDWSFAPTGYEVGWASRASLDVEEQILSLCPPVEVPPTFYCNQYMALAQKGVAYHHLSKECGTEVL